MPTVEGNIRVGVIHGPGQRMTPVWFDLRNRKHTIRQITNTWRDRQGETVRIHFHVTDEGALYELVYDLGNTTWALEQIETL